VLKLHGPAEEVVNAYTDSLKVKRSAITDEDV
jgi:hypothetical protein